MPARPENPFVFGELVPKAAFVDRENELTQLRRDLTDGEKIFLLSPRRFGKSSLVAQVLERLRRDGLRTALVPLSSATTYTEFLERFVDAIIRAAGPFETVKHWLNDLFHHVRPQFTFDPARNEVHVSFGPIASGALLAPDVFALPEVLATRGRFRMAICLDEFQQIEQFGGIRVENPLRNAVQTQREVGYVFAGSQPSLMEAMLQPARPFFKAGPVLFLDKIAAAAWETFIPRQFAKRGRVLTASALARLLAVADLIPHDVQRIAHELWDYAELTGTEGLDVREVDLAVQRLVRGQAPFYEQRWEQLAPGQRSVLQALAAGQSKEGLYSTAARHTYRLGPGSSVDKALKALHTQDILGWYQRHHFFVDPLFAIWIREHR